MKKGDIIRKIDYPEIVGIITETAEQSPFNLSYKIYPLSGHWEYKGNPLGWYSKGFVENLFKVVV